MFSINSSDIYTNKYVDKFDISEETYSPPNGVFRLGEPQPHRFNIISCVNYGSITVVRINYPDCENFSGEKILVYSGDVVSKINNSKIIDPHFLESELSPMIRISPSKEGNDFLNKIIRRELF